MRNYALLPLLFLPACTWIGNTADAIGSHLPTVGEPCAHWQCITESGQQRSEMNKKIRGKEEDASAQKNSAAESETPAAPVVLDTSPPAAR